MTNNIRTWRRNITATNVISHAAQSGVDLFVRRWIHRVVNFGNEFVNGPRDWRIRLFCIDGILSRISLIDARNTQASADQITISKGSKNGFVIKTMVKSSNLN